MKNRPVIQIEPSQTDKIIDTITAMVTIAMIAIPLYYYSDLPSTIPIHFDGAGKVDGYGSKNNIWLMPVLGLFTFIGIRYLLRIPHRFNYPTEVTEENAEHLYKNGLSLMRYVLLFTQVIFLVVVAATIFSAIESKNFLGPWFTISILLGGFILPIIFAYRMTTSSNKT